jgi:hypothetical protein
LDNSLGPPWIGGSFIRDYNNSYDGGKTWNLHVHEVFFGAYFFVSEEKQTHYREASNLIGLLQDFGGLFEILFVSFSFFGARINFKIIKAKFIRMIFYRPPSKNVKNRFKKCDINDINVDSITFNFGEKINFAMRAF